MWRKGNNSILMVGIYIGVATVENSVEVSQKTKKQKSTIWPSNPNPGHISKREKNSPAWKDTYPAMFTVAFYNYQEIEATWTSQVALVIKNPLKWLSSSSQCRRYKRCGFSPWVGKIPWRRAWKRTPYSCLENPMGRGAWWAMVNRIAKSQTWPKWLSRAHSTDTTQVCSSTN